MIELRRGSLDDFFEVPFRAYPADSPYVSPMRSDLARQLSTDNPLFADADAFRLYTAHRDGEAVGRIVCHLHPASDRAHGWRRACFGFFDCVDDSRVAGRLLEAAERFGRRRGCDELVGSFELTAMQQMGVVTGGFGNAPYTDMHYNPPHLPRLLEEHGFERRFPMSTWEVDLGALEPEDLLGTRQRELLASPDLRWTTLRRRGLERQMDDVRRVLNDGFADNPMFVPLSREEFRFQSAEMTWIVDSRISSLVYRGDSPVGTVVCIPDLNPFLRATDSRLRWTTPFHFLRHRFRRRRAVIIFYSVCRSAHGQGLAGAMLFRVTRALRRAGYQRLGVTWIADENPASLRQVEKLGARRLHRLHLFHKALRQKATGESG